MSKGNGPEAPVVNDCLKYLQSLGIYHWRNSTGAVRIGPGKFMHFGKKGSSDILGILPGGRLLCVECKAPENGRLSPEQEQFIEDVQKSGTLALVVRDWQELDSALRTLGYVTDGPLFENEKPENMRARGILEIAKVIGYVEFLPNYKIFTAEAVKNYKFQGPFAFVAEADEEMALWTIEELKNKAISGKIL